MPAAVRSSCWAGVMRWFAGLEGAGRAVERDEVALDLKGYSPPGLALSDADEQELEPGEQDVRADAVPGAANDGA